jgi:hypothetical protein
MKIKKGLEVNMDCDFWYDLTDGGYIEPEKLCANKEDAKKVLDAIAVVKDFQNSLEEEYPIS